VSESKWMLERNTKVSSSRQIKEATEIAYRCLMENTLFPSPAAAVVVLLAKHNSNVA